MNNNKYILPSDLIQQYADGKISEYELRQNMSYDDAAKYNNKITAAQKLHQINTSGVKNMKVLYICGSSGSGKTTTAKYIADKLGLPYCVSAGGTHMFDDYHGEPCLILDDFRSSYMKFSDILKLMDNNTGSCVDARYHNINMSFCKLLIITSIQLPDKLYSNIFLEDEPIEQFIRRLNNRSYYNILENGDIVEINLDTEEYTGKCLGNFNTDIKPLYLNDDNDNDFMQILYTTTTYEKENNNDTDNKRTKRETTKVLNESQISLLERYRNKRC